MEAEESRKRRRYSAELKAQILAECEVPGASVAKVALSHGINANIVHGWRKLARQLEPVVEVPPAKFVAVTVAAPAPMPEPRGIDVEFRRGAATIRLTWPVGASSDLANWLRELLR
jgi:transposase